MLDSRGQEAISELQGLTAPPETQRFAFLREGTDPGEAREELAEAVSLLVEKPALDAALAATVARFDEDPEGAFAEQTRLREQLKTIDDRLKAFGRRKAGTMPTPELTSPSDAQPIGDLGTD
jgi:DNA primase